MFYLALKARLPVIEVTTTDLVHIQEVVSHYAGNREVVLLTEGSKTTLANLPQPIIIITHEYRITKGVYQALADKEKTVVLVNQPERSIYALDCGVLVTPKEMVSAYLLATFTETKVKELLPCFGGVTIKELGEVVAITAARDGNNVSAKGVRTTRSLLAGQTQGLMQVDTTIDTYVPYAPLDTWLQSSKVFFLGEYPDKLTPRGILLNGKAGVGKSSAAKYIANQFGVPLFRLDVAASLGKFVGESERAVIKALSVLDQEAPAVVLLDEVEKLFSKQDDSGVTSRLLSQLLWWLQERKSRVFVVMTTNDMEAIPPELFRSGRVDRSYTIPPLTYNEAKDFSKSIIAPLTDEEVGSEVHAMVCTKLCTTFKKMEYPHSDIVQMVYDTIKEYILTNK